MKRDEPRRSAYRSSVDGKRRHNKAKSQTGVREVGSGALRAREQAPNAIGRLITKSGIWRLGRRRGPMRDEQGCSFACFISHHSHAGQFVAVSTYAVVGDSHLCCRSQEVAMHVRKLAAVQDKFKGTCRDDAADHVS